MVAGGEPWGCKLSHSGGAALIGAGAARLICRRIGRSVAPEVDSVCPPRMPAALLCRSRKCDVRCGHPRKCWVPQCSDWHFNCLEGNGRWWPGTRGATDWLSVPHGLHHQQRGSMTKYKLEYIWLDGY